MIAAVNWGQAIADAVALGALYGLVAVGIGLVFGVLRLVNFAYGELITIGAYVLAFTYGWPRVVSILLCVGAVVALALAQELVAFRPMRRSGATPATMLVATFAVSFLLQAIYLLAFGSRGQIVGVLGPLNQAFTIGGVDIRWITVVTVAKAAGNAQLVVHGVLVASHHTGQGPDVLHIGDEGVRVAEAVPTRHAGVGSPANGHQARQGQGR